MTLIVYKQWLVWGAVSIAIVATASVTSGQNFRYAVFDLGDLGGDASNAFGINDDGTVVGCAWFPDNFEFHATIFAVDEPPVDLGTLGGSRSWAYEINNAGQIVGVADYEDPLLNHAFLYDGNAMIDLGTLGGSESGARSINDLEQVVGSSFIVDDETTHACLWHDETRRDLGSLIGISVAWDINELSETVGYSSTDTGAISTAVLWQPDGELIDLGGLCDGCRSEAHAINDLGIVVGWSDNGFGGQRATVWDGAGKAYNIQAGNPDFVASSARGINNQNQVVGFAVKKGNLDRGFIFELGQGIRFLDDLVPPRMDMTIYVGNDINEHGQIAAWGEETFGEQWYRALLLTPVDPELALSDPVPGIVGQTNTWTITGAQPNAKIHFAYSLKGGGTVVPGCDKLDAVVQLSKPKVVKTVTADVNGDATVSLFVPPAASGAGLILFQAVDQQNCEESQLTTFDFE